MKLKIEKNLKTFQQILGFLNKVGTEAHLTMDGENLTMVTSSAGNIASKAVFPKEFFDVFEGECKYGIFLQDLALVMKKMAGCVEIEEVTNQLQITSGADKLTIPILDDAQGYKEIPDLEYEFKASMDIDTIDKKIRTALLLNPDYVLFKVDGGTVKIQAENGLRKFEGELMSNVSNGVNAVVGIGVSYLGVVSGEGEVTLGIKTDTPLLNHFTKDGANFYSYTAPRVL